jgi:hypothetical protein
MTLHEVLVVSWQLIGIASAVIVALLLFAFFYFLIRMLLWPDKYMLKARELAKDLEEAPTWQIIRCPKCRFEFTRPTLKP